MTPETILDCEISSSLFATIELDDALEALEKADVVGTGFSLVHRSFHDEIEVVGEKIAKKFFNTNDCKDKLVSFPGEFVMNEIKEKLHNMIRPSERVVEEIKWSVKDHIIEHNAKVKFKEYRKKMPF